MKNDERAIAVAFALIVFCVAASANDLSYQATLSRAQEIPAPAPGQITAASVRADFDPGFTEVAVELTVEGGANVVAAHFHRRAS